MIHNDLCTCIALTKWDGPVACLNVTGNVENFQSKFLSFYRNPNLCGSISEATRTWQSCPFHFFCWFQRNTDDIAIVCRARARIVYNRNRAAVTEDRLKLIGYLEPWIFGYEFRDIFSNNVRHSRQALTKLRIKVPKANFRWYVEYIQLVSTEVDIHCRRSLIFAWTANIFRIEIGVHHVGCW